MTAPLVPTTDRPYQLLPPLDAEQRHLLRQSIRECGVLEPVVFDEDGEILDGHHRVEIAEELGIDYPRRVISDLDRPGKFAYALTVNVARRHLDQTARSGLVAQLRLRGMSIREIAKATGFSKTTVARDVDQLSHSGQLSQPDRITGADGKDRPATRPERIQTPGPVDAAVTPPADPGTTPAPGNVPSTAPSGAGPAPVSDAPIPGQEPDSRPPFPGPDAEPSRHLRSVPDPAQVEADRMETQRVQIVERARRRAPRLVAEIRDLITEVLAGINLGETGLVTPQTVADIRALVDALEARMEATQ